MPGAQGLICGGYPATDACYWLPSLKKIRMKKKRYLAASLVFNSRLLVTGGYDGNGYLKSTEWVSATLPHLEDTELPITLYGHSMELINIEGQPTAIVIGGRSSSGPTSRTFLGNLNGAQIQWTDGPTLKTGRRYHASALLQLQDTTYIVVSGGRGGGRSVELMEVTSSQSEWKWTAGKLFFCAHFFAMHLNQSNMFLDLHAMLCHHHHLYQLC